MPLFDAALPAVGKVDDLPRTVERSEGAGHVAHDRLLKRHVPRVPERPPERKVNEDRPREPDLLRDLLYRYGADGRDSLALELAGDQPRRLVADQVCRNDEGDVAAVLSELSPARTAEARSAGRSVHGPKKEKKVSFSPPSPSRSTRSFRRSTGTSTFRSFSASAGS